MLAISRLYLDNVLPLGQDSNKKAVSSKKQVLVLGSLRGLGLPQASGQSS